MSNPLTERFQLAAEAADIGLWEMDLETGVLTWDARMHALIEVCEADFRGEYEDWRRRLHPDDAQRSTLKFQTAIRAGTCFDDQFRIITPGGTIKHVQARAKIFNGSEGAPVRVVGVNYDVSEKEAALQAAAETAARADRRRRIFAV